MREPPAKARPWKRDAIIIIQAVLAAGVLVVIFHDRERRREVAQALRHASLAWLAVGVLCYGIVEVLGGLRWYLLLRVQGFRLPWRTATAIFLMGLFAMNFTPGLIGGDAVRVLFVIKEAPERKVPALLAVAMDRLMGLISLILLAALVVLCRYDWLAATAATAWLEYVTLLILAGGMGMLVLSALMARLPWLSMLEKYPFVGNKLRDIRATFRAYRRHMPRLVQALLNTLAAHIFYFMTFYCAARALGAFSGKALSGFWDVSASCRSSIR